MFSNLMHLLLTTTVDRQKAERQTQDFKMLLARPCQFFGSLDDRSLWAWKRKFCSHFKWTCCCESSL